MSAPAREPIAVLIVEDEPDGCLVLEHLLAWEDDLEVVGVAHDGAAAVRACRQHPPDVVVMDLLMPVMGGLEAISVLRAEAPGVGIVAHSAVAGPIVRRHTREHGVELVLKSGDVGDLLRAIRRVAARTETGA